MFRFIHGGPLDPNSSRGADCWLLKKTDHTSESVGSTPSMAVLDLQWNRMQVEEELATEGHCYLLLSFFSSINDMVPVGLNVGCPKLHNHIQLQLQVLVA